MLCKTIFGSSAKKYEQNADENADEKSPGAKAPGFLLEFVYVLCLCGGFLFFRHRHRRTDAQKELKLGGGDFNSLLTFSAKSGAADLVLNDIGLPSQ